MELELRVALVSNRLLSNSLPMVPNKLPMVSNRLLSNSLPMVPNKLPMVSNSLPMVPNRLPMVNMVSSKRAMASRLAMVSMVPKTGLFMATIASNSQVILAP